MELVMEANRMLAEEEIGSDEVYRETMLLAAA